MIGNKIRNAMGVIVVKLLDKSALKFFSKLLSKMKIESTFISDVEMERIGIVNVIDDGK